MQGTHAYGGFTLIEMSIVLVISGLIVGGVLVGQDLVRAGAVRAQIAQLEKYQSAVNTFRGKFNALPGDLNAATATTYGFTPRGINAGTGDGNGVVEGVYNDAPGQNQGALELIGETVMFWVDLSSANGKNLNMIDGTFNTATPNVFTSAFLSGTQLATYFPQARIGRGNYVYTYSVRSENFFGLSNLKDDNGGLIDGGTGLTVTEASAIDKKVDDGMPLTGSVMATYVGNLGVSSYHGVIAPVPGGGTECDGPQDASACLYLSPFASSTTSCFDDGNNVSNPWIYSIGTNAGAGLNCVLSFRFQ